jgi:WD40 repeat protein
MSDVFISYSRKDKVFARRVFDRLKDEEYSSWVDWIGIPYSAKWLDEIHVGINQADNFIFIISPDSLTSRVCQLEINHALQKNKRIIPIVRRDPDIEELQEEWTGKDWESIVRRNWQELSKLNFIFFRKRPGFICHYDEITREVANPECDGVDTDADDFEQSFQNLLATIREDPQHKRLHTRYLLRAQEWDTTKRHEDNLLIGREIDEAENWLQNWKIKNAERAHSKPPLPPIEPIPLEIHRIYIRASREAETHRTQHLRNIRRASTVGSGVAVIALIFAVIASVIGTRANQNANLASTQVADAHQELTHVPITLTPIGGTLQAGATQIAAIPPTLTHVAQEIEVSNNQIVSLQLANNAQNVMTDRSASREGVTLLAINALQTAYTFPADRILLNALDELTIVRRFVHDNGVNSVAFHPDGDKLLSGADGILTLWDAKTGEQIRTFTGHKSLIFSIAVSPDGEWIASGDIDGKIIVWELETGEIIYRLNDHASGVPSLQFSQDGRLLVSGSWDASIIVWEMATGEKIQTLRGHDFDVRRVDFLPDGKRLISVALDKKIIVWDIETGDKQHIYSDDRYDISASTLSPDGQSIVTADYMTGVVQIREVETGEVIETFTFQDAYIGGMAYSPDGQHLLLYDMNSDYLFIWDMNARQIVHRLNEHYSYINQFLFSPDGRYILTGSHDRMMILWDVNNTPNQLKADSGLDDVLFSPDGDYILTNPNSGDVHLRDIKTQEIVNVYPYSETNIISIAYSADGQMVAGGTWDGTVIVWDRDTAEVIQMFKPRGDYVNSIQFSSDGRYLLSGAQVIQLWDIRTGANVRVFTGHSADITHVLFTPDEKYILSGSDDQLIMLWDTQRGTRVRTFSGHTSSIEALDISPDGRYFASGAWDNTARIWDIETGEQIRTLTTDISINALKYSPAGRYVVGGDWEGLVYMWDVETGELLRILTGHTDPIKGVDFSADGDYIVTVGLEGIIRIWHTDYHDLIDYACERLTRNLTPEERVLYRVEETAVVCPNIEFIPQIVFFNDIEMENQGYRGIVQPLRQ